MAQRNTGELRAEGFRGDRSPTGASRVRGGTIELEVVGPPGAPGVIRTIPLHPRRIGMLVALGAAALVASHVAIGALAIYGARGPAVELFVQMFHLSVERNLPTFFSTCLLLLASLLVAIVAVAARASGERWSRHWTGLAVIFFYLALDEAIAVHEFVGDLIRTFIDPPQGPFAFLWVIPFGVLTVGVALSYLPFVRDLPAATRRPLVAAATVYVGGALGVEMITAWQLSTQGPSLASRATIALEESMEIAGAILFVFAVLRYLELRRLRLQILSRPAALEYDGQASADG